MAVCRSLLGLAEFRSMKAPLVYSAEHPPKTDLGLKMVAGSWMVATAVLVGSALFQWIAG